MFTAMATPASYVMLLSMLCLLPVPGASGSHTSWLRLEQFNAEQQIELKNQQTLYSKKVVPVAPVDQRQMGKRLRHQRQHQTLLQNKQGREQSALRQRLRTNPQGGRPASKHGQFQRFRIEQQSLQNRLRLERQTWPYRR